jgi:hypothetical protein
MQDPKLLAHFMAISALLDPGEVQELMSVADRSSEDEVERLIAEISTLTPPEAAATLRRMLAELRSASPSIPDETPAA